MSDLVRKGALASDRMSRDPEVAAACDDLARLADYGLLAGVAEIVRERLRQVEALGYTAEHDDAHTRDELPASARFRLGHLLQSRVDGTADYPEDEDKLRTAGALVAAEIDRAYRAAAGQVARGERHPDLGVITPDMTEGAGT